MDKKYDLFLSHASEDKAFTNPLADKLNSLGGLKLGMNNLEDLDNGLKKSDFGVIILSKNYFIKAWRRLELNAWINLLVYSNRKIIAIYYGGTYYILFVKVLPKNALTLGLQR